MSYLKEKHFYKMIFICLNNYIMWIFGKLITIVGWYVAGSMIASSLDPKKKKKMALAEKAGEDKLTFLFNDFVETHKILAKSAKEEIMSDENKKLFEKKKKELTKLAKSYKKEAEKVVKDLKTKWSDFAKEGLTKVESIYEEQKEKIEELKEIAPEKAFELKKTLLAWAKDIKDEISKKMKG